MENTKFIKRFFLSFLIITSSNFAVSQSGGFLEEVIVTAEKRFEGLQDVSQAVTALTSDEIEAKNITSMVDLSAIVPGVTVAKNEGYKTVISIRGVGNETNQNAIAAPSVAFHLDGIFIASPFALQTDFIDIERIEVIRGPQGTLFGQNSTGGAINVISSIPSLTESFSAAEFTVGNYGLRKGKFISSIPVSDSVSTRISLTSTTRDGFSTNISNGQDLDDAENFGIRNDWFVDLSGDSTFRFFAQYFDVNRNGSAMKGIDDTTAGIRYLSQDTLSTQTLSSFISAGIFETDLDFANLKILFSYQRDEISVDRDNDRHNFGVAASSIPGVSAYTKAEFRPETSKVDTNTVEFNLVSNEPLMDGKLDWTVGMFYLDHEIENHIREYLDGANGGTVDGSFDYVCGEPFALAAPNCYEVGGSVIPYAAEFGFISDAFPVRRSLSAFGETTYSFNDDARLITGLRFTRDNFATDVSNFFGFQTFDLDETDNENTGRITFEYDVQEEIMVYVSQTRGFKPGGSNLTFGYTVAQDIAAGDPGVPAMVLPTFKSEVLDSTEVGIKADFLDGKARANLALFDYSYENLQLQATDPDVFRGGVVNIPESEVQGIELEFTALLTDSLTLDANFGYLDTEITSSFEYLDNVVAQQYSFTKEQDRYDLRADIIGNELAKAPDLNIDVSLNYVTTLPNGNGLTSVLQFVKRGEFFQRVANRPAQDAIPAYEIVNLSIGLEFSDNSSVDFIFTNLTDEDGINSSMTDVFGVAGTGIEYIPPRQMMTRYSIDF